MLVVNVQLCHYVLLYYNYDRKLITSLTDLVIIANVGNELYPPPPPISSLSRQTYLLLTELPAEVIVFNTTFQVILVMYMEVAQRILRTVFDKCFPKFDHREL